MPDRRTVRASDADRHQVVEALRKHAAEGRLTIDEFDERVGVAYEARTLGELQRCLHDLPVITPPSSSSAALVRSRRDPHLAKFVSLSLILIFIWAMSGFGYPWPLWVIVPLGIVNARRIITERD